MLNRLALWALPQPSILSSHLDDCVHSTALGLLNMLKLSFQSNLLSSYKQLQ